MRDKFLHLSILVLLISSTACNPKLSTVVYKQYPLLQANVPVKMYTNIKQIPVDNEILVSFNITDPGFVTKCDSAFVFEMAVNTARQLGGNALLITRHTPPSWESSCHQIGEKS